VKSTALLCGSGTEETSDLFRDVPTREVLDTGTPVVCEDDEDLRDCIDLGTRKIDAFIAAVPGPDLVLGVEVAFARDEHQLAIILHDVNTAIDHGIDHPVRGWKCRCCPYARRCSRGEGSMPILQSASPTLTHRQTGPGMSHAHLRSTCPASVNDAAHSPFVDAPQGCPSTTPASQGGASHSPPHPTVVHMTSMRPSMQAHEQ